MGKFLNFHGQNFFFFVITCDNIRWVLSSGSLQGSLVIWHPFKRENQTRNLSGHEAQIHQLLFSPDGRFLASTDNLKKLIIRSTKVKLFIMVNLSLIKKNPVNYAVNETRNMHL
jgi:WD40 repeat protein